MSTDTLLFDWLFLAEQCSSYGAYWTVVNGLVDETLRGHFSQYGANSYKSMRGTY